MTTSKNVLLLDDGNVAAELSFELESKAYHIDSYLHDGPIASWKEEIFLSLQDEFERLEISAYDAVILAFTSERESQRRIIRDLEARVSEDTLFLVSAMAYSATEVASWFEYPERVIGFGFLPPFAGVKCLEVARALQSTDEAAARAEALLQGLGKEVVFVQDSAGLVLPRMVTMIINEAVTALTENVATAADIDTAMKLGTNYPHGPLEWADMIGLDQVYATLQGVYEEQGEDRYRPAPLLRRMVLADRLGVRTGLGFYPYKGDEENA
ncbi:MAG: 3-hydroxyacyl-CoA dehydrogenase family protein [Tumebacillaceae bacterium]